MSTKSPDLKPRRVGTKTELTRFGCRTTFDASLTVQTGESISYPMTIKFDEDGRIISADSGDAEIKQMENANEYQKS